MHNLPFQISRSGTNDISVLVHTDLNGLHNNNGCARTKYFLTFRDDYSKCTLIYTFKFKSEVYNCFLDYINKVDNFTGKKIKKLKCDNVKEYMSKNMYGLVSEKGISM